MSTESGIVRPAQARAGDRLPTIAIPVTFEMVSMTPFSTWDFYPGHHDPKFARAQGMPDIYLNTIALQAFADRIVIEWAGDRCSVVRRQMKMLRPAHPGDTLRITGTVTDVAQLADATAHIEVAIQLDTERGRVCDVTTLVRVPIQYEGKGDE